MVIPDHPPDHPADRPSRRLPRRSWPRRGGPDWLRRLEGRIRSGRGQHWRHLGARIWRDLGAGGGAAEAGRAHRARAEQ
ncbi:MAG: hypothetical protein EPO16_08765 [Dehalococcoidia bacterium]|nr:MAG: hypothetical protein EPO16_08765 [Dehalococcoidia bacterium]